MTGKKFIMLAILLAGLLTLSAASAADNITSEETDEIASIENQEILKETNDGTFTDLANEIANATDELTLNRNYIYSDRDAGGWITIDKSITINGNGHTIDGNNKNGAFLISGSNIVLNNIIFKNTEGTAVEWTGDYGTIENCNFINTTGSLFSAIRWEGEKGTIEKCNFINCSSHTVYSTIISIIELTGDNTTISNCNFINQGSANFNRADIVCSGANGIMTNCTFTNKESRSGISWDSENGKITNCKFTDMQDLSIWLNGVNGTISNCIFTKINLTGDRLINMNAENTTVTNCIFTSIYLDDIGINVYCENGAITNCNFTDILSRDTKYNYNDNIINGFGSNPTKITISDCNFINSPGIRNMGLAEFTIMNCNFTNLKVTPIVIGGVNSAVTNCIFTNCSTRDQINWGGANGTISNCNFTGHYHTTETSSGISIISWTGANGTLKNCNINPADEHYWFTARWLGDNCTVTDCTFIDICSILWDGANGTLTNSKSICRALILYWDGDNGTLLDFEFKNTVTPLDRTIYWTGLNGNTNVVFDKIDYKIEYSIENRYSDETSHYEKYLVVTMKDKNRHYGNFRAITQIDNDEPVLKKAFSSEVLVPLYNLTRGSYSATITIPETPSFRPTTTTTKIVIGKDDTVLSARYDETEKYLIATLKETNGKAIEGVKIGFVMPDGVKYATTDSNGQAKYSVKNLADGSYSIQIAFLGDDNYNPSNKETVKFTITNGKVATKLTLTSTAATYKSKKYIIATLTDAQGKPISGEKIGFANNGMTYVNTDANGKARYYTNELVPGTYNVNAKFFGDDTYSESNKATSKVVINKAATTLTAKYDTLGRNIVATVKDENGNPAAGVKVGFAINGVKYVTTDANGQAKYSTSDLADNTYKATIMAYGNSLYENSNKQTVTFTIGNDKHTKIFLRNAQYFVLEAKYVKVTLWDAYNNPLAGKTVNLTLDEYGLKYSGVTDENGDAYIRVGVGYGTHSATVSFDGDEGYTASTNKGNIRVIKETPSLIVRAADSHFKVENKNKNFRVYLQDRTGKALNDELVGLKLNGMTHLGHTYGDGFEVFIVYLDKAGVYDAEVIYGGNSAYNAVRKNVKIYVS